MEKALEILKACRERGQKRAGGLDLDEAISELEEDMKPKTCYECEWWDFNSYGLFKKCFNGKGNCVSTKSNFGCNRFKQKDNA